MASFSAYLEVGGSHYPLIYYDLYIHQQTDTLGRPASLTQGGTITCELHAPGQNDTVLTQWMLSPTKQHDGFVHLYREDAKTKLKTISFFNAYCVNMGVHFSATGSGPMLTSIVISPQRVAVGAMVHDNNWPVESHGAGITYIQPTLTKETSDFSKGLHTVLDIVGITPIVDKLADSVNKAIYLAEGDDLLGQDMSSRQAAFLGTAKFPYGTVGYGVQHSIGTMQVIFSEYGEARIGDLFNRPDVQELLALENTPENNLKVAQLEYNYWTDVLTDPNQSIENRAGGLAGVSVSPDMRTKIQMELADATHIRDKAVEEFFQFAQHRSEQLKRMFPPF